MDLIAIVSATTRKTFLSLAQKAINKQRDKLLDLATAPLTSVLLDYGSKFLGDFAVAVLKAVLGSQDTLKEIRDQVRTLVREPLETGLSLINTLSSV